MKIYQKILTVGLILISFSLEAKPELNVVFGVSAGYVRDLGLYNVDIIHSGIPSLSNYYWNDVEDDSGSISGFLTGLQLSNCEWLLGLEFRLNHFSMDHHRYFNIPDRPGQRVWGVDSQVKHGTDFGLLVRLGYAMAPYFMPYMHLGGETSQDRLSMEISGTRDIYPRTLLMQSKTRVYRYTGGVGVECPAPWLQTLSFRLEYMFHMPGTFLKVNGSMEDGVLNPYFKANIKPRTQSIEGAIVWNMG